jgi:hypothetical protein
MTLKKNLIWDSLWYVLFFILALSLNSVHLLDSDEGVVLAGAWDMFNGKNLYTDFFAFVPPASFYLIYIIWKLFFPSYLVAKTISIIFISLSAIGIYKIGQKINKSFLLFLPSVYFILSSVYWPSISYHAYNLTFIIFASYFFLRYLETKKNLYIFACGIFSFISFLFLQNRSAFFAFAIIFFLISLSLINNTKLYIKKAIIYSSITFLPLSLLLFKWSFSALYKNLIYWPAHYYTEVNMIKPLVCILYFFCLGYFAFLLRNKINKIYFLLILQLFLFLSVFSNPDKSHIIMSMFPILILIPSAIKSLKHKSYINYFLLTFFLISLFLPIIFSSVKIAYNNYKRYPINLDDKSIKYIIDNCHSRYIYAGPFMPNVYFETKKINPTPYSTLITNYNTQEQFSEAKELIKEKKPDCCILDYSMVNKFKHNINNPVDNYIQNNYHPIWQNSDKTIKIMKINE